MITVNNLSMQFGGQWLFQRVDLQFTAGNCYGIIGANGAGKSTFLRILSGELDSTSGAISIQPGVRMSVLKQDQFAYDAHTVLDTVIMGNERLYRVGKEKDALYEKPDFSDEDGLRASELEAEFAELGGWEAESDASQILQGLGVPTELHQDSMADTDPRVKVKVLLAQALFGNPDIVMLDEPTNNLDIESINWLEDFLLDFPGTVIVVSHDRHFLNTVCTHIVDIDYGKIKMYVGNYDFWYESSQLVQSLLKNKNKRNQEKIEELQAVHLPLCRQQVQEQAGHLPPEAAGQADCGGNALASTRRYPFVGFQPERDLGKDILTVKNISKTVDGVKLLDNVYFTLGKDRQDRLRGRKRAGPDHPLQNSHGRTGAGRGLRQMGRVHHPAAICPRTTPNTLRAAPWSWWTGFASTRPRRTMSTSAASWAGCCFPARTCSNR